MLHRLDPQTVRSLRQLKGWRSEDLAQHAGVNHSTIKDIEDPKKHRKTNPTTALSVAKALGVDIEELGIRTEILSVALDDMAKYMIADLLELHDMFSIYNSMRGEIPGKYPACSIDTVALISATENLQGPFQKPVKPDPRLKAKFYID